MKFEFNLVIFLSFLIIITLALIGSNPDDIPLQTNLVYLNQQGLLAKELDDNEKLEEIRSIIQDKLAIIASKSLEMPKLQVFLEEGYFPFRSASEIESYEHPSQKFPICDITPMIVPQLELIRHNPMFSIFTEKYHNSEIELFIQDERRYTSVIHYSLVATSVDGNYTASTWFHLDSCTSDDSDVLYNLSCRDAQTEHFMHTRDLDEINASFEDEKFCEINLKSWRQELYDYSQKLSEERNIRKMMADMGDNPTQEIMMAFQLEMHRSGLLGNMAGHAMDGNFNDEKMNDMKQEYREMFGEIPDDLLKLLEKGK